MEDDDGKVRMYVGDSSATVHTICIADKCRRSPWNGWITRHVCNLLSTVDHQRQISRSVTGILYTTVVIVAENETRERKRDQAGGDG